MRILGVIFAQSLAERAKSSSKPDIEEIKPDIDIEKADIENVFLSKTVGHILKLEEVLSDEVFSRKDVIRVLGLKESKASGLIKQMEEKTSLKRYAGLGKENTDSDISMNELCFDNVFDLAYRNVLLNLY